LAGGRRERLAPPPGENGSSTYPYGRGRRGVVKSQQAADAAGLSAPWRRKQGVDSV